MDTDKNTTYSVKLGLEDRRQLAELAEATSRKPPDVVRFLIRRAHEELVQSEVQPDRKQAT